MKTCTNCNKSLPATSEFFCIRRGAKDGLTGRCRKCVYAQNVKARAKRKAEGREPDWRKNDAKYAARDRKIYLEKHGEMPDCACGCGEKVEFIKWKAQPKKYFSQECKNRVEHDRYIRSALEMVEKSVAKNIPIEQFRISMRELKDIKGWTWREMAELGGISYNTLTGAMYNPCRSVKRETATTLLRRLSGLPVKPKERDSNELERAAKRERSLEVYDPEHRLSSI